MAAFYRAPTHHSTIDFSCFYIGSRRTICFKNIILWSELEQFQMGFHGGCCTMWPLEEAVALASGIQAGERDLGEEWLAYMPERLSWQLHSLSHILQPPKQEGKRQVALTKAIAHKGSVLQAGESEVWVCFRAVGRARDLHSELGAAVRNCFPAFTL